MRTRLLLLLALTFCLALTARAEDWTRFRGPNGTGVSADKTIPAEWIPGDVRFRVELPGKGHSSPIVVGKRLFVLSATAGERLVLCYDALTGKQIWSKSVSGEVGKTHPKSSLASSTPCSDGERLYCSFWDGKSVTLYAYDFDGKQLWQADLGRFVSQHGPGFSPIVVDGKVIVNLDQDGSAVLLAFDAKSGKSVWRHERPAFRACYSTPFVTGEGKARQLIVASTAGVTAYGLDGKPRWNYEWEFSGMALRTVGSAVAADGLIFACAGDGSGERSMIAVRPPDQREKASLAWKKTSGTPYVPTLLARNGYLYGVEDKGAALCIEAKSGKVQWQARLGGLISASPVLIDGKVYAIDETGTAYVFAAEPDKLKVLGKNKIGEVVFATPAVANGRLYVRGVKHLICVERQPAAGQSK